MYPVLRLDHLQRMTDPAGIFQHAIYTLPDPQRGYTLDDNARAFIVALKHHRWSGDAASLELARHYLAFIRYAQTQDGRFLNFLPFDRQWHEQFGSPDSNGRAIGALGYGVAHAPESGMREAAGWLLERALAQAERLTPPRAIAFALLGFAEACRADWRPRDSFDRLCHFADRLAELFDHNASDDWPWYEPYLTYSNAALPRAMLAASAVTGNARYQKIARYSLDFLVDILFQHDMLDLIGQKGWYRRHGERAHFDQQPIDAACTVEALVAAEASFGESRYGTLATIALEWFYGRNRVGVALYDPETGGCYDGLVPEGVNRNQGAESTLAHLMARLLIEERKHTLEPEKIHAA